LFWEVHGPTTTGAIAIGTTATSASTTTTISIATTILTASKEVSFNTMRNIAEPLAKATRGSTTRNTAEMRPMGTDKRRINMAARLAGKVVVMELALAEAALLECNPVGPALAPVDRVSAEATDQVAVQRKISGLIIVPVAELVEVLSVAAIALAVARVPAVRVAAVAETVSEIAVSHPAQGSGRVATLLVEVGLTGAPLDPPAVAEVPAWAAVELVVAVAEDAEAAEAGAEGNQII
jgi:hypothetical protein